MVGSRGGRRGSRDFPSTKPVPSLIRANPDQPSMFDPRMRSPESRTAHRRRGFSLVELVVVITIVAIAAGTAVVAVDFLPSARGKAAARQVARDVNFARSQAMMLGRSVWVDFDAQQGTYSISVEPTPGAGRAAAVPLIDPATGKAFLQRLTAQGLEGTSLTVVELGGGSRIGFDWQGRPKIDDSSDLVTTGSLSVGGSTIAIEAETGLASCSPD